MTEHDREFGSVGRRLGAGCIDLTCVVVVMAGAMGGRLLLDTRRRGDVLSIHREDARTGGPVTVRNVLIRHLAGWARGRLVRRLTGPRFERQQAQMQAVQRDVEAARREHPDDKVAQQRATMQVYRDADVNPASCCWWLLAMLTFDVLVLLATPRHQSVAEWIAGIVVIRD